MGKFTRRAFMVGGAAVGGTLALGVGFLSTIDTSGYDAVIADDGSFALNAWVTIKKDGTIQFAVPRLEMGQGVFTSLPMLLAEELEVDLSADNVSVVHPQENLPVYANFAMMLRKHPEQFSGAGDWLGKKMFGLMGLAGTGGSTSIVDAYTPLRKAGAIAREMLISAAAKQWGIAKSDCFAENGQVVSRLSGDKLSYGELAEAVSKETPDENVRLKPKKDFKLVGKPQKRVDIPSKVNGTAKFGVDVVTDDMLFGTVMQSPVFGGVVKSINDTEALKLKGVKKVVNLGDAVGVIADSYYKAKKALDYLDVEFDDSAVTKLNSDDVSRMLKEAIETGEEHEFVHEGDVEAASNGQETIEAYYEVPYLAHATMEPINATACVDGDKVEIWSGNQMPANMESVPKDVVNAKTVTPHIMYAGGGFGRRVEKDAETYAVKMAAAMPGIPVKVIYSREEDMQHDVYRPAAAARLKAVLGSDGYPDVLDTKVGLQPIMPSFSKRNLPFEIAGLSEASNMEGLQHSKYEVPNRRLKNSIIETNVPVGFWRSVSHTHNAFFLEGFVDELAHKAGHDPFEYRQHLLKGHKRLSALLAELKKQADWAKPVPKGKGRGIAVHESFLSYVGEVFDISLSDDGEVTVDKVTCVVDCGSVVNPDTVKAQMESGIIFGLSAALFGEITLDGGAVEQTNFTDYEMVKMRHAPEISVTIMENDELPGGVGEPGTPPVYPALANAIFAAGGKRIRSMPITKYGYSSI
ncbi:xanthine dehydrogenase family protein molybdopterin-binding subunit [Kordiimonas laminariae]|uniref:xanthine dehydrogenase family protein molybdopterin-binding subunit n=1 Tax=Kordiimonas laminariae TaxID=2917717 RepID=UPI001FF62845|nr:molybdopterin cofactor-binding domain-containing protein [Kordiimonas laminariae]MCK0070906.1 molybdopterin-dependent oxidoreductase [Kordiimonas laminariae]